MTNFYKWFQFDKIKFDNYLKNAGFTTVGSPSEAEVFRMRARGETISAIADNLNCSIKTIQRRIQTIKIKILIYEFKLLIDGS